jgi:hypothetical protein
VGENVAARSTHRAPVQDESTRPRDADLGPPGAVHRTFGSLSRDTVSRHPLHDGHQPVFRGRGRERDHRAEEDG